MSFTPQEAAILALWDEGRSTQQIARETGRDIGDIRTVINRYVPSLVEQRWAASVRASTRELAAALARSGGRFA